MAKFSFKSFKKNLPIFLTSLLLAITVWIISVTASDPAENRTYPKNVPIEVVGMGTDLVRVSDLPSNVSIVLNTPQSVWEEIINAQTPVRAILDLSGLGAGSHQVNLQIQVGIRPVKVVSHSPRTVQVVLDSLATRSIPLTLEIKGEPAIGYQAETPKMDVSQVMVMGPQSQVEKITVIKAILDVNQAYEDISRIVNIVAYDQNEMVVDDITLTPDRVSVIQEINQRYGYRDVIVSVTLEGQVAYGYRLTNITVVPLAVTVYSTNSQIVNDLPGYVKTMPLNLDELNDNVDVSLLLDLPEGVMVVGGNRTVLVRVSVAAIQSSMPLANIPIEVVGLAPGLQANLAPEMVTLLISGPLHILDELKVEDVRVILDLTDYRIGKYELEPVLELPSDEIVVNSIQPPIIDFEIIRAPTPTPGG